MPLRLIMVGLILATAVALGFIALQVANPPQAAPAAQAAAMPAPPPTVSYLVAAHPLAPGTLERDADLAVASAPRGKLPEGAIVDDAAGRASLFGALVQRYVEAGEPLTAGDIMRPRERGFLAAVLAPGTRAVSIAVDPVTGVSGLIWPGDRVDVILTQEMDRDPAVPNSQTKRIVSETVLSNVRVIAVDQDIVQGAPASGGVTGKLASTVTLQATSDQAERLTVAGRLGRLSLAIRAIGDSTPGVQAGGGQQRTGPVSGEDVSPALARANNTVVSGSRVQVIQGDQRSEVNFR